jgi:hypothetical protein
MSEREQDTAIGGPDRRFPTTAWSDVLAGELGNQFHRGVVLYAGREAIPFGENLHALPLSFIWS